MAARVCSMSFQASAGTKGSSHFFPTLIKELGFKSNTIVLLLTSPPYLFAFVWAISFAYDADRRQKRSSHATISGCDALATTAALVGLTNQQWPRYALVFLVCAGTFGIYSITYTWLSSTIVRPPVKRAAAIGIANTCANTASRFANYFWLDQYEHYFRQSRGCLLAFQLLGLGCNMGLRYSLKRTNHRFERLAMEIDPNDEAAVRALDEDAQRAIVNRFRYIT